jgi:hypothetical protein
MALGTLAASAWSVVTLTPSALKVTGALEELPLAAEPAALPLPELEALLDELHAEASTATAATAAAAAARFLVINAFPWRPRGAPSPSDDTSAIY